MTTAAVTTIILFTVFIAGAAAGVLGVITMAVHRTERNHTLPLPVADSVTQTGRWLHGVYVRTPVSARAPVPAASRFTPPAAPQTVRRKTQPPPSGKDPASSTWQPRPGCPSRCSWRTHSAPPAQPRTPAAALWAAQVPIKR